MLTSDVFVCMTKKKSLTIQEKVSLLHIYQLRWCPTLAILRSLFLENCRGYGGKNIVQ